MSTPEATPYDPAALLALAEGFALRGTPIRVAPLGDGLIHATFALDTDQGCYVLQRINRQVFPRPERIMANLGVLARHLARHPAPGIAIPLPIPRRDGAPLATDPDGHAWRLMERIPEAVNLPGIETHAQGEQVGFALGRFHRLVADLPPRALKHTLPGFHVTLGYLARLDRVLSKASARPLGGELRDALAEIERRRGSAGVLDLARRDGQLPLRVTHGDPKLDNILFHRGDGRVLGLIDLDTVQPGLIQHDLGDCLRSCCNHRGESTSAGQGVSFDLETCQAVLAGYAQETRGLLGATDMASLYDGIRLVPFELAVRFLTDHLAGDRYFRVTDHGENLTKALTQLALTADIEQQAAAIRELIRDTFRQP